MVINNRNEFTSITYINNSQIKQQKYENYCACKGIRYCNLCANSERVKNLKLQFANPWTRIEHYKFFVFNPSKKMAIYTENLSSNSNLEDVYKQIYASDLRSGISIEGLLLIENFITEEEEEVLVNKIDKFSWNLSQSGRRKQVLFFLFF